MWGNRIIIKNTLVSPEACQRLPIHWQWRSQRQQTAFLETKPSASIWLDIQRFSLSFQVGNSHKVLVILYLSYCNAPFSASAQLYPFRYFPKDHFLFHCFVPDTTFPPPSYHSNQNHTHLHSHSFIDRVDSQAGGEPSIIFSLILQQDFPGEVSFTVKWFNLQKGATPLPSNSRAHHSLFSPCICFCIQSDLTVSSFGKHKSLQKSNFSSSLASQTGSL